MSTTEIVTEELLKIFILDEGKDENTFIANHLGDGTWITKNVYGGALFAQSLVAAEKTVPKQFLPHSIHSLFILNGKASDSDEIHLIKDFINIPDFSFNSIPSHLQNSANPRWSKLLNSLCTS